MKALIKSKLGYGHLEIVEKKEPSPGRNEVKIEVKYAGICGTDVHTYEGHYQVAAPVTLGHEFSGVVVEVGEGVTEFNIGDRVTSETTYYICGDCKYCQTKDYNLCSKRKGLGTQQDGAFAKYVIARKDSVHFLPEKVDFQSGALTEPLACTYHAIDKVKINKGDIVVVLGPGPIGLLAAQVAKSLGAIVVITGLSSDQIRLEKAIELGIDFAVNIEHEDVREIIGQLTNGFGADVVLECSGSIAAAQQGLSLLCKKGRYVQIGIFSKPVVPFDLEKVIQKEICVIGSRSQKPSDWLPALRLLAEKKVNAKAIVTHIFDISEWDKAYEVIKNGEAIKVLLKPID